MARVNYFSVGNRNPGHWDISDHRGRMFRIRGRPSSGYHIYDERTTSTPEERKALQEIKFPTDIAVMNHIVGMLMWEPVTQEHEDA